MLAFAAALLAANPHLAAGETALAALDYDTAAYELMLAATDNGATDAERIRANLEAGIAHRVLGRDLEARMNFRFVLLHAPSTTLPPETSPKVALFFESVRQEIEAEALHTPPPAAPAPPPPSPAPPPGIPWSLVATGTGGLVLLAGGGALTYAELSLADPHRDGQSVGNLRGLGGAGLVGLGVGALVTGVGALVAFGGP